MLSLVGLFVQLGLGLISPILPLYAVAFNATVLAVGFLVSAFGLARVFLDIPSGILADRVNLGKLTLLGLVGLGAGALLSAFAWDYNSLLAGRILQGAFTALFQTSAVVVIARLCEPSERGRALSVFWGLSNVGLSIGPGLGGIIASITDLRMPFIGYAITALIGIPLVWPILGVRQAGTLADVKPEAETDLLLWRRFEWRKLLDSLRDSSALLLGNISFMLVVLTSLVFFFVRTGVSLTIAPLMGYYSLGMDVVTMGAVLTASTFATVASMIALGAYSDKVGRRRITEICLVLLLISLILIPLSRDTITFAVFMGLFGLSIGPIGSMSAWVTDLLEPVSWGKGIGVQRLLQDLGMALGPSVLSLFASVRATPIGPGSTIPSSSFALSFLVCIVLASAAALAASRARDPIAEG